MKLPSVGISKEQALADAGIPLSTARRYEELTGPHEKQARRAGNAAGFGLWGVGKRSPGSFSRLKTSRAAKLV
jgi:hypothetical protein